jgi:hypothetical protein
MTTRNYKVQAIITSSCKIEQCQYWDLDGGYCFIPRDTICPKYRQIATLYELQETKSVCHAIRDTEGNRRAK